MTKIKHLQTKRKPLLPHWYKIYIDECVLCGAGGERRERQYTPKPKEARDRYDYRQSVCGTHF